MTARPHPMGNIAIVIPSFRSSFCVIKTMGRAQANVVATGQNIQPGNG